MTSNDDVQRMLDRWERSMDLTRGWRYSRCFLAGPDYVREDGYTASWRQVRKEMSRRARIRGEGRLASLPTATLMELEEDVLSDYDRRIKEGCHRRKVTA